MRVTQSQIKRQYINNSNSALTNMNSINNRILTQRKFTRASEAPVDAAKALIVRRELEDCTQYTSNLKSAEGTFSIAEKALINISGITQTISDSILQGATDTAGPEADHILANQIRNLAKEIVSQCNISYADRYLLGGTNNETPPFKYDEETKEVTFNGVNVLSNNLADYPQTGKILVDVGMGIKFNDDGTVDEQTVMDTAINGVKFLGYGTDDDGDPKNLVALAFMAADALDAEDSTAAMSIYNKLKDSTSSLMVGITTIGNLEQSVTYNQTRVTDMTYNLKAAQNEHEGIDLSLEITNYKVAEMAYNATLSMGSQIVPNSIFDFIR